jgi:hypothetical protein
VSLGQKASVWTTSYGGWTAFTHDNNRGASPPQADFVEFIQMAERENTAMGSAAQVTLHSEK